NILTRNAVYSDILTNRLRSCNTRCFPNSMHRSHYTNRSRSLMCSRQSPARHHNIWKFGMHQAPERHFVPITFWWTEIVVKCTLLAFLLLYIVCTRRIVYIDEISRADYTVRKFTGLD